MADTVFAQIDVRLMLHERRYWTVPLTPEEITSLPDTGRRAKHTADRKMLLVSRDDHVPVYRLPER
jgi:hypothetical protein